MTAYTPLYLRADELLAGDILPDISRQPIDRIIITPRSHALITFKGTEFKRHTRYGGDGYGFECFRVERPVTA